MGLAPSGQHENTTNLLYAEVPVPIYSHRRWAGYHRPPQVDVFIRAWLSFGPPKHTYVSMTLRESRLQHWIPACAGMTKKTEITDLLSARPLHRISEYG
jgi:hypothetical protein